MIARGTDAEVSVIALVGERGREVREFIENDLGPEGLARSVVVVATSDAPPVERLRAAFVATRIAEYFRDDGRARRADDGQPHPRRDGPARDRAVRRRAARHPRLPAQRLRPAARGCSSAPAPPTAGSITGLYTVLVEGDDMQDPIGDTARSILDGHVVLSRRLATAGHFPSIDVLESISRVTGAVTTPEQRADADRAAPPARRPPRRARARRDRRLRRRRRPRRRRGPRPGCPPIDAFLRQDMDDTTPTRRDLAAPHELVA